MENQAIDLSKRLDEIGELIKQDRIEQAERAINKIEEGLNGSEITEDLADKMFKLGIDLELKKPRVGDIIEVPRDGISGCYRGYNMLVLGKSNNMGTFFMNVTDISGDVEGVELPNLDDLVRRVEIARRYTRSLLTAPSPEALESEIREIRTDLEAINSDLANFGEGTELPDQRKQQIESVGQALIDLKSELDRFEKNPRTLRQLERVMIDLKEQNKMLREKSVYTQLPDILRYVNRELELEVVNAVNSSSPISESLYLEEKVDEYKTRLNKYKNDSQTRAEMKEIKNALEKLRNADRDLEIQILRIRENRFDLKLLDMVDNYQLKMLGVNPPEQQPEQPEVGEQDTSPGILENGDLYLINVGKRNIGCAIVVRPEKFDIDGGFEYTTESGKTRFIKAPLIRYVGLDEKIEYEKDFVPFLRLVSDYLLKQFRDVSIKGRVNGKVNIYYMLPLIGREDVTQKERKTFDMWTQAGFRSTGKKYEVDGIFSDDKGQAAYILRKSSSDILI